MFKDTHYKFPHQKFLNKYPYIIIASTITNHIYAIYFIIIQFQLKTQEEYKVISKDNIISILINYFLSNNGIMIILLWSFMDLENYFWCMDPFKLTKKWLHKILMEKLKYGSIKILSVISLIKDIAIKKIQPMIL